MPPMSPEDLIPLRLLPVGRSAEVAAVVGAPEQIHRMRELGLREGARIEMLQAGSPCLLRMSGAKYGFRADELTSVLVRLGTSE